MLILGLDLETTGLSPDTDRIIEIGAVAWDTQLNKPVAMLNHLINTASTEPLPKLITNITGITDNDLNQFGIDEKKALLEFKVLASQCHYIIAHNGNKFDKLFLDNALERHQLTIDLPWIDSMTDVPYRTQTKQLTHLAAEHGFLNPFSHRALFDVLTMLTVCSKYDWQEIVMRSQSPTITIIAKVAKENRHLAKDKGFRWNSKSYKWYKEVKQCDLEKLKLDFEYSIE